MDREVPGQAQSLHTLDLEQIRREIALLEQWRDVFSHPGLGTSNAALQLLSTSPPGRSDSKRPSVPRGSPAPFDDFLGSERETRRAAGGEGHGQPASLCSVPRQDAALSSPRRGPEAGVPKVKANGPLGDSALSPSLLSALPPGAVPPSPRPPPRLQAVGPEPPSQHHPGVSFQKLRQSLLGSSLGAFSADWEQACFRFQRPASALAFALQVGKGGARSVQMAVQGFIVKHLLFPAQGSGDAHSLSALGPPEQGRGLAAALTTILWAAGAARRATVCLVTPTASDPGDDVIERLRLFELSEREATEQFIYDHLPCFEAEGSRGVVLFLCSLVLSRTLESLQTDLDSSTPHLLRPHAGSFLCRQAAVNLLLTGRASPQVFNGRQEGPSGDMLQGVQGRSEVGYLQSGKDPSEDHRPSQVGSMLQTPRFPIWLCNLSGSHSVLFSTNRQLVADWKAERVFGLHLFDGHLAHLTVDTHAHPWESTRREEERRPGRRCSPLETAIRTKWSEASVHWAGPAPSV